MDTITDRPAARSKALDLTGQKFGRLTAVRRSERSGYWSCSCECGGQQKEIHRCHLRGGKIQSCGCISRDLRRAHSKAFDITGQTFGKLTAISVDHRDERGRGWWLCSCVCGGTTVAQIAYLRNGHVRSCGCLAIEALSESRTTHGATVGGKTPTYETWRGMRYRCSEKNNASFPHYGGRGIKVCERWNESFEAFLADMGERPDGMTLDRIDVNGDYESTNCRWATYETQARNRDGLLMLTINGETLCLGEWVKRFGVPHLLAYKRIRTWGWDPVDALTRPARRTRATP